MSEDPKINIDRELFEWFENKLQIELLKLTNQIKEDREFIKDTVINTLKIGGGLVAISVAILTFSGYQHFSDLDGQIQRKVEEKFKDFNPQEIYKKDIKTLSDRALVSSYNIQFLEKQRFDERKISVSDTLRITDLLLDPTTEDSLFLPALQLLHSRTHDGDAPTVDKTVMLLAKGEDKQTWIRTNPQKWAAVWDAARERRVAELKPNARQIAGNSDFPDRVRVNSIEFLAEIRDADAISLLDQLTKAANSQIAEKALYAIGAISPEHSDISMSLTNIKAQNDPKPLDIANAVRLASDILETRDRTRNNFNESLTSTIQILAKTLELAIDRGCIVNFQNDVFADRKAGVDPEIETVIHCKDDSTGYVVPNSALLGRSEALNEVLEDALRAGSMDQFVNRARAINEQTRSAFEYVPYHIVVKITGNSEIQLQDGNSIRQDTTPLPVAIAVGQGDSSSNRVFASWVDNDGVTKKMAVTKFIDLSGLYFSLSKLTTSSTVE